MAWAAVFLHRRRFTPPFDSRTDKTACCPRRRKKARGSGTPSGPSPRAGYRSLPERDPGKHWYDSIKLPESVSKKGKKLSAQFEAYTTDFTKAYLSLPARPVTDPEKKREKTNVYVEGLLRNGGPSTDVFKQALGEEKCAEMFRTVLFGTN